MKLSIKRIGASGLQQMVWSNEVKNPLKSKNPLLGGHEPLLVALLLPAYTGLVWGLLPRVLHPAAGAASRDFAEHCFGQLLGLVELAATITTLLHIFNIFYFPIFFFL